MFAVIKTGGKQYRVAADDMIKVDKVRGDPGEIIQFGEVPCSVATTSRWANPP